MEDEFIKVRTDFNAFIDYGGYKENDACENCGQDSCECDRDHLIMMEIIKEEKDNQK